MTASPIGTVSYTHLDVYKRQSQRTAISTQSPRTTQSYIPVTLLRFVTGYTGADFAVNPENIGITFKDQAKIMSYVNNIKMFVRVFELGSMSAAARDQRTSPAVASARISEIEKHLGVRLFSRTTRSLQPTENGRIFFDGAKKILEAIDEAEAAAVSYTHLDVYKRQVEAMLVDAAARGLIRA